MDKYDRMLLAALLENGRATYAQLARQVPETLVFIQLGIAAALAMAVGDRSICRLPVAFFGATLVVSIPIFAFEGTNTNHLIDIHIASVVAIVGYDEKFFEHLPFLFPHADAKAWFAGNDAFASRSAFQNGTLQVAYLILALRAVGLDTGPMTGFDNAKVDAEFFPEGAVKSNVIINIGYGDNEKLFPRSPRFAFDQIAKII